MNLSPTVSLAPSIDLHSEFTFAQNTDTTKCCCWMRSNTVRPNDEIYINTKGEIERFQRKGSQFQSRLRANAHLAKLVKSKFEDDPIANDDAFKVLQERINHDFEEDHITSEKLQIIVESIYSLKREVSDSISVVSAKSSDTQTTSD